MEVDCRCQTTLGDRLHWLTQDQDAHGRTDSVQNAFNSDLVSGKTSDKIMTVCCCFKETPDYPDSLTVSGYMGEQKDCMIIQKEEIG